MNGRHIYSFTIRAESPIYFGGDAAGELLKDGDDRPFVTGNSIGGALRDYLDRLARTGQVSCKDIRAYMGGLEPVQQTDQEGTDEKSPDFRESRIFISDGLISLNSEDTVKLATKWRAEGTAIDPAYGSARHNHKYKREYLPQGTKISFNIECDVVEDQGNDGESEAYEQTAQKPKITFAELIYIWAGAIHDGRLRLGGQKSNGYGEFSLDKLEVRVYKFDSAMALDCYIFNRDGLKPQDCTAEILQHRTQKADKSAGMSTIIFSLKGRFPYGVFQAFKDEDLSKESGVTVTGLQKNSDGSYFIPAASIKGLLRNEVRRLFIRMLGDA